MRNILPLIGHPRDFLGRHRFCGSNRFLHTAGPPIKKPQYSRNNAETFLLKVPVTGQNIAQPSCRIACTETQSARLRSDRFRVRPSSPIS